MQRWVSPQPTRPPPIVNAGISEASREVVADAIAALYRVGIDAVLMGLQSYHDDTRRFAKEIVPLLSQAGVV